MKKIYFVLAAAMLSVGAFAQTLTQANHAMSLGNMFSTKQCDSTGVTPGGNGPSQTWNYSTITIHNSTVKNFTAVTVASTGSASAYPSAAIAVSSGANGNSFYSSNATDYKYWGGDIVAGAIMAVLNYSSAASYARYPMSLTGSTVTAIGGTISASSNVGSFTGNCTVTATGSGALNLPGMTFPNVLKVTTAQVINFNLILPGVLTQITYDYYSPSGSKAPLFTINSSTMSSGLGTSTQSNVAINSNYMLLGVKEQQDAATVNFEAFPNPASENINISFNNPSNESVSYEMINSLGQLVKSENIQAVNGNNKSQISLNGLESGLYFVVLKVGEKAAVQKITVR